MKKIGRKIRRMVAGVVAVTLLLTGVPGLEGWLGEGALSGISGMATVEAASAYEEVFKSIVQTNITDRMTFDYNEVENQTEVALAYISMNDYSLERFRKYESRCFPATVSFTEEEIRTAIDNSRAEGINYSVIKVPDLMSNLLGNGTYVFYLMDADSRADVNVGETSNYYNYWKANYNYNIGDREAEGNDSHAKLTTANPWIQKVIGYKEDNIPLSPGLDYSGQAMNADYTIGQLIVDYLHANYAQSVLVTDERIIEIYDSLATEKDTPFVDMDTIRATILADINAGNIRSNADKDYTEMLKMDEMITVEEYIRSLPADAPIPDGTLLIGTWLMDAQSITEPFYRMAVDSMTTYNQQVMLYKSELSSGYWKNIYGASGLDDILPVAENVPMYAPEETSTEESILSVQTNEDGEDAAPKGMAGYYIDIIVGADGIPKKAKTGEEVDVFSLVDPYELDGLPELKALKAMFDAGVVKETDENLSNRYIWEAISGFFQYDQPYDLKVSSATHHKHYNGMSEEEWKYFNDFIFEVARHNLAFYAQDPRADRRCADIAGESGRAFINSLELTADVDSYVDGFLYYNWNGHSTYSGRKKYISYIIRGDVTRDGEKWLQQTLKDSKDGDFHDFDLFNTASQVFRTTWRHKSQLHDETTDLVDARMTNLKNLYNTLCRTGDAEDKELAYEAINVENSLDAVRRYEAYYNLVENDKQNYYVGPPLLFLYEQVSEGKTSIGGDFDVRMYTKDNYADNGAITSTVEEAIVAATSKMYEYQQQALTPGTTIASQVKYDLSNNVIDNAPSGVAVVRPYLRQLVDLDNITKYVIAHKSRELSMINTALLPTADVKFAQYVHQGAGEDYQRASADPATTANALDEILKDQKAGVSAVASELQMYIAAKAMRLPTQEAIDFIKERINVAEGLRTGLAVDAFGKYAGEALDDHIKWLKDLLSTVAEGGSLTDDGNDWDLNLDKYEGELEDALNNGDLDGAQEAEKKLAEAKRNLDDAAGRARQTQNDPNAAAADKVTAEVPGTPDAVGNKIADDVIQKIRDNEFDDLDDELGALEDIGSPRLPDILDELDGKNAPASIRNRVEEAVQDLGDPNVGSGNGDDGSGTNNGPGNTGGDGDGTTVPTGPGGGNGGITPNGDNGGGNNGNGKKKRFDKDGIDDAISNAFGRDLSDLDDDERAATLAGLTIYDEVYDDEDDLHDYLMDLLQEQIDAHSVFIYRQYLKDPSREYVSLAAVSRARKYTRFRLVQKEQEVTMSQIVGGSASYVFGLGEKDVTKNNGDTEQMDVAVDTQEDPFLYGSELAKYPYITEESSGRYLYNTCAYVPDTEWAVLITPATDKKIAQLLDVLDLYAEEP